MHQSSFDAIIIGVGGMGSAAVYQLAKRGIDVLGIERYDIPPPEARRMATPVSSG